MGAHDGAIELMASVELVGWVACARLMSRAVSLERSMRWSGRVARAVWSWQDTPPSWEHGERLAWRASRVVRGADCYDRALATRVWLARRGVRCVVVVGMRREAQVWEGHAWLEVEGVDRWFLSEGLGYREVWRDDASMS